MERMQPKELSLFKASDGTAAVDMSVALVTEPIPTAPGGYASMTAITPAGPSGTWSAEDTDVFSPDPTAAGWDAFPSDLMSSTPTQPAGSGATTRICAFCTGSYRRYKWTPSSGGTDILPTALWAGRGGL